MASNFAPAATIKGNIEGDGSMSMLGSLAWWGSWKVKVEPSKLIEAAEQYGLPLGFIPDPPTAETAFRRAVNAAKNGKDGIQVSLIESSAGSIVYGVQRRTKDESKLRVDHIQYASIAWLPAEGKVITDSPEDPVIKGIIEKLPEYRDNFVTDDIRKMVGAAMREARAVSMTSCFGVGAGMNSRFVPVESHGLLEALHNTLASIPGTDMMVIKVPDEPVSRGSMQKAARSDLAKGVEAAEKQLTEMQEAVVAAAQDKSLHGPRNSTLVKRIKEYQALAANIEMYTDVLKFKADDLQRRLVEVSKGIGSLLGA